MRRLFAAIRGFAGSLAGTLALILTVGMSIAAIVSLLVAEGARKHDFERYRNDRLVISVADIAARLVNAPADTERMLAAGQIVGAHPAPPHFKAPGELDTSLDTLLIARLGPKSQAFGRRVDPGVCLQQRSIDMSKRAAGFFMFQLPDCWVVNYVDPRGKHVSLAFDLPPLVMPPSTTLNPLYLLLIVAASAILSVITARLATAPLRRLTKASRAFAHSIDAEPIAETGPSDVRAMLASFNLMQHRVRDGVRERTQMLAAIGHDLQTPLTRLRLRLEQVQDVSLRDRLIADLTGTLRLIRDGLELARSRESREAWSVVDIDSLLSSLAEDAAEFGADVQFTGGCGAQLRVKPDALVRCVTNLVDNAVKYAGNARISCVERAGHIDIVVHDDGPGIPEDRLTSMLEPFVRGASPGGITSGTGIGLTIAKAQAETFGARLTLANAPGGGLDAIVWIAA